jgi:muramoyltetrapeptide carboxypeptidase LdcA involved in peptidoglycan recycling
MKLFPLKLNKGDEVRVIAPSSSLKIVSEENINYATCALEELGLKVTFGKNVNEIDIFNCSSIESRIEDLHAAFADKNVKAILAAKGASNANQLLRYIDYELIKQNPKIFCGFSDINVLQNAIYHKTGVVTYSGPQFSSFAMQKGFEYSLEYFKKIFFDKTAIDIKPSYSWSDDEWFRNQENRTFHKNEGYVVINHGEAEGTIIGGNLCTLQLLHGTEYMPSIKDSILFIEADAITAPHTDVEFDRDLQSLIHQPYFDTVKALVIGRFETRTCVNMEKLRLIIKSKQELNNIPVISNADFGHTMPMFTFPIGGVCRIKATESEANIKIIEH